MSPANDADRVAPSRNRTAMALVKALATSRVRANRFIEAASAAYVIPNPTPRESQAAKETVGALQVRLLRSTYAAVRRSRHGDDFAIALGAAMPAEIRIRAFASPNLGDPPRRHRFQPGQFLDAVVELRASQLDLVLGSPVPVTALDATLTYCFAEIAQHHQIDVPDGLKDILPWAIDLDHNGAPFVVLDAAATLMHEMDTRPLKTNSVDALANVMRLWPQQLSDLLIRSTRHSDALARVSRAARVAALEPRLELLEAFASLSYSGTFAPWLTSTSFTTSSQGKGVTLVTAPSTEPANQAVIRELANAIYASPARLSRFIRSVNASDPATQAQVALGLREAEQVTPTARAISVALADNVTPNLVKVARETPSSNNPEDFLQALILLRGNQPGATMSRAQPMTLSDLEWTYALAQLPASSVVDVPQGLRDLGVWAQNIRNGHTPNAVSDQARLLISALCHTDTLSRDPVAVLAEWVRTHPESAREFVHRQASESGYMAERLGRALIVATVDPRLEGLAYETTLAQETSTLNATSALTLAHRSLA